MSDQFPQPFAVRRTEVTDDKGQYVGAFIEFKDAAGTLLQAQAIALVEGEEVYEEARPVRHS